MNLQEMSAEEAAVAVRSGPVVARCAAGWMLLQPTALPHLVVGTIGGVGDATAEAAAVYAEAEAAASRTGTHIAVRGASLGVVQIYDPLCLCRGEPASVLARDDFEPAPRHVEVAEERAEELVAIGEVMLAGWNGHLGLFPYCGVAADRVVDQRSVAQGAYDAARALLAQPKRPRAS